MSLYIDGIFDDCNIPLAGFVDLRLHCDNGNLTVTMPVYEEPYYKNYKATIKVNDSEKETLSMCCKSKTEAKQLANEIYDGFLKMKYIASYQLISIN